MKNKEAKIPMVIVGLVILLIGGIILIIVYFSLYTNISGGFTDSMVLFGTNLRDSLRLGGSEFFPELGTLRVETIKADDLDGCPYFEAVLEEKKIEADSSNRDYVYSICAAEQLLEYNRRCWYIRGAGKKDAGNLDCFRITVTAPKGVNIRISTSSQGGYENDFQDMSNKLQYENEPYSKAVKKIDTSEYWSTHGGDLIGTDWEMFDRCIDNKDSEETWGIFYNDEWYEGMVLPIDEDDELWFGCTNNCENDEKDRHDCKLSGEEASLRQWWEKYIGEDFKLE